MRAVVETHGEAVGGKDAAEQVVNSEAKAAITHQTHLGNRTPAALAPCTDDQHSTGNGEIMSAQKDRAHAKQIATMIAEDAHLDRGDIGNPTTSDLISREAAIAALLDHGFDSDDVALDILLALPAAQIGGAA